MIPGNVVLNFGHSPDSEFAILALGYHKAGRTVVNSLKEEPNFPDYIAYPVVFLYRQSLELYMKAIVISGARVIGVLDDKSIEFDQFLFRHNLTPMLPALEVIFSSMRWEWDFQVEYARNFAQFRNLIAEFESLDRDSFAFRYPVDKSMKAVLPRNLHFNLFHFAGHLDPILDGLDGAITGIEHRWDRAAPILFEAQQIIRNAME